MPAASSKGALEVYLECGARRTFACATEWPGWCRSGKTEELALETLAQYAPRYALVAAEAGIAFDPAAAAHLDVRERLAGNATTEFGAPAIVSAADRRPLKQREAEVLVTILRASWTLLERAVESAPAELRKGPRGGGRDRDAIFEHVVAAEFAYARKLGLRGFAQPSAGDAAAMASMREAIAKGLEKPVEGSKWPVRYAARRVTWHSLDHLWEIEDRSSRY